MERRRRGQPSIEANGRIAVVALLVVQILLGYEWLASGLTKLVHGDFPGGLADELAERPPGVPGWYRSFLDAAVIPHAHAFGYLVELGEFVTGVALIAAAVAWLASGGHLPRRARVGVLVVTVLAAVAGVVMNVNFHLVNGSPFPSPVAADSFDEAVDLDSLMAALELVLVAVGVGVLVSLRKARGGPVHQRTERRQEPRSGRETIPVSNHIDSRLSLRARSALWLLAPLVVGLALGAAAFGGRGGTASAAPARTSELAALQAKLGQAQQDVRLWKQLTAVFKPAPQHLRLMQDHRLYVLPSGVILGLHFDNMNLAKARNLNWVVFGVPGRFTKADQQRVTREYGPGFTHFHDLTADTHGGKPGAKGAWFVHIGARDFTSPFGQVTAGAIDTLFMPTPPRS